MRAAYRKKSLQARCASFGGGKADQKVKLTGALDPKSNTSTVVRIEAKLPAWAPREITGFLSRACRFETLPLRIEENTELLHNLLRSK